MTNAYKYLKDGIDVEEFVKAIWGQEYMISEEQTLSYKECKLTARQVIEFLKRQLKPTLTEDEKVILRNIDIEHYQRIGRVKKGLYVANAVTRYYIKPFEPAFQFIQPRRRI